MLGDFLVITEQVLFERQISLFGRAAWACAGNRAHGDQVVFNPHQHFRRAAHDVEVTEIEDNLITVRPIAGTRPRGATEEADLALEEDLLSDDKEIAEH